MNISVISGLAFGDSGQRLDVYGPDADEQAHPVVLLWHGSGPDERDVLAPLARATASLGVVCFVPDWRPDAEDAGRTHLRESAAFVQQYAADFGGDATRSTLAGWSRGAKIAVAVALDAAALDSWRPRAVVAAAGGYVTADPLTGQGAMDRLGGGDGDTETETVELAASPIPIHLIHGTADTIVDVDQPRRLHTALRRRGWPTTLTELDADHAGVVMTVYDPELRRCVPSDSDRVLRAGNQTAQLIAQAAISPSSSSV
ncbi:putative esterase [Catenulispora sp. GP43]|uniref:alpha/beta hydrolase family protein n=1 Tax=Catenulispora sp. GP43 TaxID=3156263 RepID=UPI0035169A33